MVRRSRRQARLNRHFGRGSTDGSESVMGRVFRDSLVVVVVRNPSRRYALPTRGADAGALDG
jgi:hypothetical protein